MPSEGYCMRIRSTVVTAVTPNAGGSGFVGLDLGATQLRAVVGDDSATIMGRARRPTPADGTGDAVTSAVLETVKTACDEAGIAPDSVAAAGVGTIGPFGDAAGTVVNPSNLPGVDRIELVGPLASLLDADVIVHNDAVAGVIGERFAADDDPANLVYLTLSTGVGGGAIVDGTVLSGHRGNAVEVGHVTISSSAPVTCGCGAVGHWEALCGGANLPAAAAAIADETDDLETSLDPRTSSPRELLTAAGSDPLATRLASQMGEWNAIGIAMLVHAYDPARVHVGGAIAVNHPEMVLDPIRSRLPALCLVDPPPVRLTTHGDTAVVRGALASAITGGTGRRPGTA